MTARAWRCRGAVPRVRRRLGKGSDHRLQEVEFMPYIREAGSDSTLAKKVPTHAFASK